MALSQEQLDAYGRDIAQRLGLPTVQAGQIINTRHTVRSKWKVTHSTLSIRIKEVIFDSREVPQTEEPELDFEPKWYREFSKWPFKATLRRQVIDGTAVYIGQEVVISGGGIDYCYAAGEWRAGDEPLPAVCVVFVRLANQPPSPPEPCQPATDDPELDALLRAIENPQITIPADDPELNDLLSELEQDEEQK